VPLPSAFVVVLPGWRGAPARLVEVVVAISLAIVVSELVGAVHIFYRIPEWLAAAVTAIVVLWTRGRERCRLTAAFRAPAHRMPSRLRSRWRSPRLSGVTGSSGSAVPSRLAIRSGPDQPPHPARFTGSV
jgi:hypothetical protein